MTGLAEVALGPLQAIAIDGSLRTNEPVSYTHLTLPTIYSV